MEKTNNTPQTEEGITPELLARVQESGRMSPAIITQGEEPVNLVKCSKGFYWIQAQDMAGTFRQDKKGGLLRIDQQTAMVARARYYQLFSAQEDQKENERRDQMKQKEVEREMEGIREDLRKKVETHTQRLEAMLTWAYNPRNSMSVRILENTAPKEAMERKQKAKAWLKENPNYEPFVIQAQECLAAGDFDSLYMAIETEGMPLLMSANYDNAQDMEALGRMFGADAINRTLDRMQDKGHLEKVALVRVEKRYTLNQSKP